MKDQNTTFVTSESYALKKMRHDKLHQASNTLFSLMSDISSSVHQDMFYLERLLEDPFQYCPIPHQCGNYGRYERGEWSLVPVDGNQEAIDDLLHHWSQDYCFDWTDPCRYVEAIEEIEEAHRSRHLERVYGYGRSDAWELLPVYTAREYFEPKGSLGDRAIGGSRENIGPLCAVGIGTVIGLHLLSQSAKDPRVPQDWIAERRNVMEDTLSRIRALVYLNAGGDLA